MYKRSDPINSRLKTPFPALTPAQRYHFECFGYVILEKVFDDEDVAALKHGVFDIFDRYERAQRDGVRDASLHGANDHNYRQDWKRLNGMGFSHERLIDFNTHPYLVGMSEEVVGSAVRVNETTAIANQGGVRQDAFGWHRGADVSAGCHYKNNLFHCNFVKTLVALTDFGPDNGGTICLPGSHKLDTPQDQLKDFANKNAHLRHQFIAPKGSVFLFAESLIHASGENRSDEERVLLISGFNSRMLPNWDCYEGIAPYENEAFMSQFPDHIQLHFKGFADWTRDQRYRSLEQEAVICDHKLGSWRDRESIEHCLHGIEVDCV